MVSCSKWKGSSRNVMPNDLPISATQTGIKAYPDAWLQDASSRMAAKLSGEFHVRAPMNAWFSSCKPFEYVKWMSGRRRLVKRVESNLKEVGESVNRSLAADRRLLDHLSESTTLGNYFSLERRTSTFHNVSIFQNVLMAFFRPKAVSVATAIHRDAFQALTSV